MGCLPLSKAGDRHFHCLFGTDERETLLTTEYLTLDDDRISPNKIYRYYLLSCWNSSKDIIRPKNICDRTKDCPHGDDELFCDWHQHSTCNQLSEFTCKNGTCISKDKQWCNGIIDCIPDGEDERLCDVLKLQYYSQTSYRRNPYVPFSIDRFIPTERRLISRQDTVQCHRGIVIHNDVDKIDECLCPPSYYGAYCEQQSERLTILYRVDRPLTSDRRSFYQLVFYLLDENREILTHETMIYIASNEQFSFKQLIYLNYPRFTQTDSMFSNKSVRIDAYRMTNTLVEPTRLSWFYSVQFSDFLPVTRLAVLLYLEEPLAKQPVRCRNFSTCQHGVCQVFSNSDEPFCRCEDGWFGLTCDQRQSTDLCVNINCNRRFSKCIIYNNHAFCLCVLGRMGPKCEIASDACSSITCKNQGTCIALDERTIPQLCICPTPYFGDRCQYTSAELKVNIPSTLSYIPVLTIHFLHTSENLPGKLLHRDFLFFRNVHSNTQLIINYAGQTILPSFVFAQRFDSNTLNDFYYLLVLSNKNRSHLTTEIRETHRCPHVNESLNSTLINESLLKRIKFYHVYVKNVKCFYDETYMCLVDKNGFHDCLIYNHNITNCIERTYCENGGRCLQRKKLGQLDYVCVCPRCTSGVFCQIQMSEFTVTLDTLIGETIINDVSLHAQPTIIKILLVLISVMFAVGLISNVCSIITFRHKDIRKIGCGHYLLILSIANQVTVCVFGARVIYLIYSQMVIIDNKKFLNVGCFLFDFILQVSISFCDWLHTCVACERMVGTLKGVHFSKSRSVYMVKFVVPILFLKVIFTSIHHVFNRELIADPRSDERMWCVIKHRDAWLRTYEICINIFNSFISVFINFVFSIILLVSLSMTRQRVAVKERYRTILISQIIEHKDLLIAPVTIIIAKLPLFISSLIIKCISEQWHVYVSLTAYFLSLMPLISTFFIFVWPSVSYMSKFKEHFRYFRRTKRRRAHPNR